VGGHYVLDTLDRIQSLVVLVCYVLGVHNILHT